MLIVCLLSLHWHWKGRGAGYYYYNTKSTTSERGIPVHRESDLSWTQWLFIVIVMLCESNVNEFSSGQCNYYNLTTNGNINLPDLFLSAHLNIRSLSHKVSRVYAVLNVLSHPKRLLLTETWLSLDSSLLNFDCYSFISPPPEANLIDCVAMFVHNSIQCVILYKSYDNIAIISADVLVVKLLLINLVVRCLYCSLAQMLLKL